MKNRKNILIAALIILILLIVAIVPTVLAFMFTKSNEVNNSFEKATVMAAVREAYDTSANKKTSIKLQNTGNVNAYLRLRLVSYWVGPNGEIVGKPSSMPMVAYDLDKWIKDGDTFYYKYPVAPSGLSDELLSSAVILGTDTDYVLMGKPTTAYQVLEIIPEAVQAEPTKAAGELWGNIQVNSDGEIEIKPTPTAAPTPTPGT